MATYWENSCSFGLRYVSWYKCLIVSLVFSHLGFWSGNHFLIAPFPDLCLLVPSPKNTGCFFRKLFVELKSSIRLLYFNTKNEMPVSVSIARQYDFKRYQKFDKNIMHNTSMGTKQFLQVQHDFWNEISKPKRLLLVGFHLHYKRGSYVSVTFNKKTHFLRLKFKQTILSNTLYRHGTNVKVP